MGIGLAGIARGLKQGFEGAGQAARQMEEDERKKRADERDAKRFTWEEARAADEDRVRKAGEEFDNEMAGISQFISSGGATPASKPERAAGIATPADAAAPQAQSQPMGLSMTPNSQAVAPEQAKPANPFMIGTEGKPNERQLYDQMMKRQEEALARYYTKTRQIDKLQELPEKMAEIREKKYVEKTKTALAAMSEGAPGAVHAASTVYQWISDGYSLVPGSGEKFDPKTGVWSGLVRVNDKTGEKETFSLSRGQLMSMAGNITAAQLIKYNDERRDKAFDQSMESRKVAATERSAAASETSASASMLRAKNMNSDDDLVRNARIDADIGRTISSSLSTRFKVDNTMKPSDNDRLLAGAGDKDAAGRIKTYENQMKALGAAQGIAESIMGRRRDVNKGVTVQEATALAAEIVERRLSGKEQLQAQSDDKGVFVMRGSKKIYIQ